MAGGIFVERMMSNAQYCGIIFICCSSIGVSESALSEC